MAALRDGLSGCRRRGLGDARGSELVEFALILPLLLILVAGIVDFALMFQAFEVVTNAAREGARMMVLPGYSEDDARSHVRAYITAAGLAGTPDTVVTPTIIAGGAGGAPMSAGFQVSVAYVHPITLLGPIFSLIGGSAASSITLNGVSVMRAETTVVGVGAP
jgi:Flp pilus assembly protein TadG